MTDPLFDTDLSGTLQTERHTEVRYRAGRTLGQVFSEEDDFDGLTLTLEVSGIEDAHAMLAAIAKPQITADAAGDISDFSKHPSSVQREMALQLARFMDACAVENAGSAYENEQATSYLIRGAEIIRAMQGEIDAVKKHEKVLSDELDLAEEESASFDTDYAELEEKYEVVRAELEALKAARG